MSVKKLDFVMKDPLNDTSKTTYTCSGFSVTGNCDQTKTKQCIKELVCSLQSGGSTTRRQTFKAIPRTVTQTLTPKDWKISKMIVNMGPDGTRDDVKMKICSDVNSDCCATDKLSNLLSREWVENKQETWESGKFGKCKKQVFKVMIYMVFSSSIAFSLIVIERVPPIVIKLVMLFYRSLPFQDWL